MYVVIYLIVGVLLGAGLTWFYFAGPVLIRDRGFRMFVAASPKAQLDLVKLLDHFGLHPRYRIDSPKAGLYRVLMDDNMTSIYTVEPKSLKGLNDPKAALGLPPVRDPIKAAHEASAILHQKGYATHVVANPDPNVPEGRMALVVSDIANGTLLVFRRHAFKMGPRPPRWKW